MGVIVMLIRPPFSEGVLVTTVQLAGTSLSVASTTKFPPPTEGQDRTTWLDFRVIGNLWHRIDDHLAGGGVIREVEISLIGHHGGGVK